MKPLCIDMFCGLGGWSEGFLAEGYHCIGFDIERHRYPRIIAESQSVKRPGMNWSGSDKQGYKAEAFNSTKDLRFTEDMQEYPGELVLQDILTLHGSQFRDADCIVASPPCQNYSYMAMPWSRAKAMRDRWLKDGPDNRLFDACFRIQREACEAAGRFIPMVVENVRGAQPWVGRAAWSYGSFYLWGDVPALMPSAKQLKVPGFNFHQHETNGKGGSFQSAAVEHQKQPIWFNDDKRRNHGIEGSDGGPLPVSGVERSLCFAHEHEGTQRDAVVLGGLGKKAERDGLVGYGGSFGWDGTLMRRMSSKSSARKAASAQIAKIPFALSRWIAQTYYPSEKLQEAM